MSTRRREGGADGKDGIGEERSIDDVGDARLRFGVVLPPSRRSKS
jgi:hypothetical protein